ncbi:MAG: MaoC family dehydratase [Paracoccaceae bacterium]
MTLHLTADWTPTQAEFDEFARISGDDNPIHLDDGIYAIGGFPRPVAHGMLIYARLWAMLREERPMERPELHMLVFPNPCYAGEPLRLDVRQEDPDTRILLRAIRKADDAEVMIGELEVQ